MQVEKSMPWTHCSNDPDELQNFFKANFSPAVQAPNEAPAIDLAPLFNFGAAPL